VRKVLDNPRLYDLVQSIVGLAPTRERLKPHLATLEVGTLIDVGAGTGIWLGLVPDHVDVVAVDVDSEKLARLRTKHPRVHTITGDATRLPFDDGAADYALCVSLTHHLDDAGLDLLLAELARVARRKVILLDLVSDQTPRVGRLLWALDRGSHPRPSRQIREALERRFVLEHVETYSVHHRYLLCIGVPRTAAGGAEDGRPNDAVGNSS
jgi:ubiquinone/menaquinone biosynthesis C-methylase UbiE